MAVLCQSLRCVYFDPSLAKTLLMPLFITYTSQGKVLFRRLRQRFLGFYKHTVAFYFIAMRKFKSDTHKEIQAVTG